MIMKHLDRPLRESYWVVPGKLLAGEYPGQYEMELTRKRVDALLEAGFDTFIDLTGANETYPYRDILFEQARAYGMVVAHERFPIGDFGLPTPKGMNDILDRIEEKLSAGHKIYVHCWGGIGRTGTTVGCYLVRQGKTGEEALDQLAEWWRGVPKSSYHLRSPETQEQVDFVRKWAKNDTKATPMR
jgi:hypothetical protein